jgi:hypothetical protein
VDYVPGAANYRLLALRFGESPLQCASFAYGVVVVFRLFHEPTAVPVAGMY